MDGRDHLRLRASQELIRLDPAAIVLTGTPAALALKRQTTTIPIILAPIADPIALGLARSLARPGGNVTGLTMFGPELAHKRMEIFKEAAAGARRIAVLRNAQNPLHDFLWDHIVERAGRCTSARAHIESTLPPSSDVGSAHWRASCTCTQPDSCTALQKDGGRNPLLNHLVSAGEHRGWDIEAERLRQSKRVPRIHRCRTIASPVATRSARSARKLSSVPLAQQIFQF
jgi:hypothetical protein